MAKEKKHGPMEVVMKETLPTEKKKVKENSFGPINLLMKETL